ncbi:NAD(P)-dependent oxidoreductase [Streptomyces sp. NPDC058695]|uniref:NAD(P)-dependent oxidoreductase n=1 Tax=Streptomyces sp. NPDC058695 TaxID=3346604 RepID=UPI00364CB09D
MKRGAYLINTARIRIVDRDAIRQALNSGQLAGYTGDAWCPQPVPTDHPWRTMSHHGKTPHISGSPLSSQSRYAAGTREILVGKPVRDEYLIVTGGALAGAGAHPYAVNDKTANS